MDAVVTGRIRDGPLRESTAPAGLRNARRVMLDRLSLGSFALILVALSLSRVADYDTGFHLRAGEAIWRTGEIPTRDFFSYIAQGRPWVDSQWLFQLLLYAGHGALGSEGLAGGVTLLVLGTFAALVAACHRENRPLAVALAAALCAVFVSYHRFLLRPDLLSMAFLAVFVLGSERVAVRPRVWLVVLPLLQAFWANAHGLAVLGPAYLGLGFAGDALQTLARRSPLTRELRLRGALALLCSLALLANANGWSGIVFPVTLLQQMRGEVSWYPSSVSELISPFRYAERSALDPIALYRYFALLSGAALVICWRRIRLGDLLNYAAFLYLSAAAVRNIPLFAIVAAPIAVRSLVRAAAAEKNAARESRIAAAACVSIASLAAATWIAVATNQLYDQLGWMRRFGVGELRHVPVAVVERLRALDGRFLNDPTLGGYLIWKLYPDKQVAMDGRWDVYGELLPRLRSAFRRPEVFEALVREFDIQAVVLSRNRHSDPATERMFARNGDFELVVKTPDVALYERRSSRARRRSPRRWRPARSE